MMFFTMHVLLYVVCVFVICVFLDTFLSCLFVVVCVLLDTFLRSFDNVM